MEGYYTVFDKGAGGDPAKAQVGFADISCGSGSGKKSGGTSDVVIGAVVVVALFVVAGAMFFWFRSSSQRQQPQQTDLGQPLVENQYLPPTNPTTEGAYVANPGNPTTSAMPHTSVPARNDGL